MAKVRITVSIEEEALKEIDRRRNKPDGAISRSAYVNGMLIRELLRKPRN